MAALIPSTGVLAFEVSGSSFALLQTLPSADVLGMAAFSFDESHHCIAVASGGSVLYCWNDVSQRFDKIQDIPTREAVSVEYLTVANHHFLVFPCNGSDNNIPSFVYVWQSDRFFLYQYLPTMSAVQASFAATSLGSILIMSQSSSPSSSKVFSWNGTHFSHTQSFDSNTAFLFSIGEHIFAASSSVLHRYLPASNTFAEHSVLQGNKNCSIRAYAYFNISTEHYLVVSSQHSASTTSPGAVTVHKLNGMDFVPYQTLQPPPGGVTKVRGFEDAWGRHVLALASAGESVSFYRWVSHLSAS